MARRLRLLHTADWHLGIPRTRVTEHACFGLAPCRPWRSAMPWWRATPTPRILRPGPESVAFFLAELHRRLPELTRWSSPETTTRPRLEAPEPRCGPCGFT